eukprot:m.59840 g.59840  ORF g.59840 m.59840 type:complete len:667 (+) comp13825_c2_seq1:74-2074(+)
MAEQPASTTSEPNTTQPSHVFGNARKNRILGRLGGTLNGYKSKTPGGRRTSNSRASSSGDGDIPPALSAHKSSGLNIVTFKPSSWDPVPAQEPLVNHVCIKTSLEPSDPGLYLSLKSIALNSGPEATAYDTMASTAFVSTANTRRRQRRLSATLKQTPGSGWGAYAARRLSTKADEQDDTSEPSPTEWKKIINDHRAHRREHRRWQAQIRELTRLEEATGQHYRLADNGDFIQIGSTLQSDDDDDDELESARVARNVPEPAVLDLSVGTLVWAKYRQYPFWPAQISDNDEVEGSTASTSGSIKRDIWVLFFGDDTYERIRNPSKQLRSLRCPEYQSFVETGTHHATLSHLFKQALAKALDIETRAATTTLDAADDGDDDDDDDIFLLRDVLSHHQTRPDTSSIFISWADFIARFGPFLPLKGDSDFYHVFLSYRWSAEAQDGLPFDSTLVEQLANQFALQTLGDQGNRVHVFYDKHSLHRGTNFNKAFMQAMCNSLVVCPVITPRALLRMRMSQDRFDSVLCEWWLALFLLEECNANVQSKLRYVIPVFAGTASQSLPGIEDLIATDWCSNISEDVNEPTYEALAGFARGTLGQALPRWTVREVAERMSGHLGLNCSKLVKPTTVDGMLDMEARIVKQILYDSLPASCVKEIMKTIEKATSEISDS